MTFARLAAALGTILVLATGCGGSGEPEGESGNLATISSVQQFSRAFDEARGHPRLVLLLSPT